MKDLWKKKPFHIGVYAVGAILALMVVAQLSGWLGGV